MKHAIISTLAACCAMLSGCAAQQDSTLRVYAGTYGEAIHIYDFNPADGSFLETGAIAAPNPSYLAFGDADGRLYAVNESGARSGISSFAEHPGGLWEQSGFCDEIGADPCHVYPMPGTPYVFTADYSGGALTVFKTVDGAITECCQSFEYESAFPYGEPLTERQTSAHIHQVKSIPADICKSTGIEGVWVLASDLGNDMIHILKFDGSADYPLTETGQILCGRGAGPRHLEFNAPASMLYCITELSGEVIAWKISSENGAPIFSQVQRVVADEVNAGGSADIHLSPDGNYLYCSHRLQNDGISIFSVGADGMLTKTGYANTGRHPRNFAITADGTTMLVACRDDKSIEVYDIDESTGLLTKRAGGLKMEADAPVCVLIR